MAFIRRRLPTVVEFADNVHRDGYQVPDEDRATLARLGDDLTYALDRAEIWREGFADMWGMYHARVQDGRDVEPEEGPYIGEDETPRRWWSAPVGVGPDWYLGRSRYWALASVFLFVGHLVVMIIGRVA